LYTIGLEEHGACIFRVEVRSVRMLKGYIGVGRGLGYEAQKDWPIRAMTKEER
jgi:hypothetical protein